MGEKTLSAMQTVDNILTRADADKLSMEDVRKVICAART